MTAHSELSENPKLRWRMLAIAGLAQAAMALNWFNISPALSTLGADLEFGVQGQSLAVSAFVVGFVLLHIPGGMFGARIGIKQTMILGAIVEALGTAAGGFATNLTTLVIARFIAGVGGSVITVVAVGAMTAWFHKREITLAMSVITGVAFTVGIAVAFYAWSHLQVSLGWTVSSVLAGVVELIVAVVVLLGFRTPRGQVGLEGADRIDLSAIWAACRNRHVLVYGAGLMGTYGVYITVSQLLVPYATGERGLDAGSANLLGGVLALISIPFCLLGGRLADLSGRVRLIIVGFTVLTALSTLLIPLGSIPLLWLVSIGAIVFFQLAFPAWTAVPGTVARVPFNMVAAASGVMFALAGIGGIVMPILYGALASSLGYTAAWITLAVITAAIGLLGVFGGNARTSTAETSAAGDTTPTLVEP
jgi:MFS family permease